MSKSYIRQVHTCITHPLLEVPVAIVHAPGDRVWVAITYADETSPTWVQVGDGMNTGFDAEGGVIFSIPQSECGFLDDEEAESMLEMMSSDATLMSHARG